MLRHSVLVTQAPYDQQGSRQALEYCRAALSSNETAISCVFFYQQGVHNANHLISPSSDEINIHQQWCQLYDSYRLPLLVCVTAAARRGILDAGEAMQQKRSQFTLTPPFNLVGLGEFFNQLHDADRLVQF